MTEKQYKVACERIEELLKTVGNETYENDKNFIELDFLSDVVADYEEKYFPVETPNLQDVLKLRMYEMGISQVKLSEILNVSPSRVSEYLTGKSEPTLKVDREISKKLKIDASVVLGV
ncbi:helix-turn-helix domain-containing protein [Chryseobacterium indoltheticum]|uniref:helix-turn-helix domain-containing protein n=1 Tax=Chryseobacterium indoltheticum TaxID=254 RepID=UPI0019142EF3|nr:helix-turn-helix domain-containing protein [Chryseobacterium indoltheticum]QQQ27560.1 helix-turn-helix domain-containing protein [Chryseobacterium indoltheticum]